jgi:hypothetical protein
MNSSPDCALRSGPPATHILAEIPDAVSRLFQSFEPSAALIVSCSSGRTPAIVSIRRQADDVPLAVVLTDEAKAQDEARVKDYFRDRAIPVADAVVPLLSSSMHQLIYRLAVPVDAMAEIVSGLLAKCFLIGETVPLDFNFVRA